jgi:hypothetical protein
MLKGNFSLFLLLTPLIGLFVFGAWRKNQNKRRAAFIDDYRWPAGLLDKLAKKRPTFDGSDNESSGIDCASSFSPILGADRNTSTCRRRPRTTYGTNSFSTRGPIINFAKRRSAPIFITRPQPFSRPNGANPMKDCAASGSGAANSKTSILGSRSGSLRSMERSL